MVGNDVVDLHDPDADRASYSPRFSQRVFSPEERRAMAFDADPARCHWRYWAAKEAVYKALRKFDAKRVFSPKRLAVEPVPGRLDQVRVVDRGMPCAQTSFLVCFFDEGPAVHAVTLHPRWSSAQLIHGFSRNATCAGDGETPGGVARRLACRNIARALGWRVDDLEVRKQGRVPVLFDRGRTVAGSLSLSHHGAWSGFAFAFGVAPGGARS